MAASKVDLQHLAVDRKSPRPKGRRRPWFTRYVLPGMILLGFSSLVGWAARDQLLPAKPVTVVPVVVARAEVQQAGTQLFQAAGWIEPRPTPLYVPALTEGVVDKLLVVEGQKLEAGEAVARLVDVDARIALGQAKAELELRESELATAKARLTAADSRLKNPVHLDAVVAEALAARAEVRREIGELPFKIEAMEAQVRFASENFENKKSAGGAVAGRLVLEAENELTTSRSQLKELQKRMQVLQEKQQAVEQRCQALARQRELLIDEQRAYGEAQAEQQAAQARMQQSGLLIQNAQLMLDRTVVCTPVAGRVLNLIAHPGSVVNGQSSRSDQQAGAVVSLYDPSRLQVRVDVRLEDVPLVQPGQKVRIETASVKEPIEGVVLFNTSQANIQKNTLEVKVAIESPPETIRPEMLVRATFLAPELPTESEGPTERERLLIPRTLVEQADSAPAVWIVDADSYARRRSVTLGSASNGDLTEATAGVTATDRLIAQGREGLSDGARVRITAETSGTGSR